ncbi:hypothetical protein [Parachlamydia sp. AcF125]|uniref:hypothetical protein n=1 Tax=Parachlamydia sp. AcF125 TaxID=2795736 RepID=UPI001BC9CB18|nr:hypothetical protein [Parachlamydia sp. AcF125]MBS4168183.1 hypothetical protein [Parachlamydia sp. AcF125]
MKFATAKEHRDFFQKHHLIEFADLLSQNQATGMANELENALGQRLNINAAKVHECSSEKLFLNGRDLSRSSEILRKGVSQHQLAHIASELFEKRPVRLGYDQFFPVYRPSFQIEGKIYQNFLSNQARSLTEISCIQGVLGGLMLALPTNLTVETTIEPQETTPSPITIFPSQPCSGVFFTADLPLDFSSLLESPQRKDLYYLLIAYTEAHPVYIANREDPLFHTLRQFEYGYGDRLNERYHPTIYR